MTLTVMSWSQRIWQLRRTPGMAVRPLAVMTSFSAWVMVSGSPAMNWTRQVVQRALPPQAWSWSVLASSARALTRRFPVGISKSPMFSMVSLGMARW
ncbi:MAG: hypothetical protein JWN40_2304 [Phycisphaerales bacterium]|nr:hypothetical protein [Phycisphaerales bacterium]